MHKGTNETEEQMHKCQLTKYSKSKAQGKTTN